VTSFITPHLSPSPTPSLSRNVSTHEFQGHADVTLPAPPPPIHRLSELIDVATLPIDEVVRSPSGRLLPVEDFLVHPDRPRSMRERQEEIRERLEEIRARSRLGMVDGIDEKGDRADDTPVSPKKVCNALATRAVTWLTYRRGVGSGVASAAIVSIFVSDELRQARMRILSMQSPQRATQQFSSDHQSLLAWKLQSEERLSTTRACATGIQGHVRVERVMNLCDTFTMVSLASLSSEVERMYAKDLYAACFHRRHKAEVLAPLCDSGFSCRWAPRSTPEYSWPRYPGPPAGILTLLKAKVRGVDTAEDEGV